MEGVKGWWLGGKVWCLPRVFVCANGKWRDIETQNYREYIEICTYTRMHTEIYTAENSPFVISTSALKR